MSARSRSAPAGQLALAGGRPMNEAELQRHVIVQARDLGWGITLAKRRSMLDELAAYGDAIEVPPLDGLVFHPRYSLGSEPGWPDLTLIRRRDRRLVFAELKAQKGRLSDRQIEVLDLLRCLEGEWWRHVPAPIFEGDTSYSVESAQIQVAVWRPSDLLDGTIEGVLR